MLLHQEVMVVSFTRHIRLLKLALLCISSAQVQPAVIIFDLGDVLLQKSTLSSCRHIGISKFFGIYNPFGLEKRVFQFLDHLKERNDTTPWATNNGLVLPQIMCDWLSGAKTNAELRALVKQGLRDHDSFFSTSGQKRVVGGIAQFMFTPEKFIKAIYPIAEGARLLKKCYRERDEFGNRKHKIYILSNWDPESFALLIEKNKNVRNLLNYCDGIVISGEAGCIKPDGALFEYLFEKYSIDPDQELTIFIDDQLINIEAARNLKKKNLHAIQCKNLHFKPIKRKLKELEVLT